MKNIFITIGFILFTLTLFGQERGNYRTKTIAAADTLIIDTLSIAENSVILFDLNGNIIPQNNYSIDAARAMIIFKLPGLVPAGNIRIAYRVFPVSFSKTWFHKDIALLADSGETATPFNYSFSTDNAGGLPDNSGLVRRGSISRGISFGNNQDVIVNSSLNLQLSGKLSDNLSVMAAITDNNIPIQPDGNTQQIQEFDKVYITVFNDKTRLTAGDYEISSPPGHFMRMYKKVQGAVISQVSDIGEKYKLTNTVSGAVSKGKYNRISFSGTEGNQGPYKLRGADNETFIIILAGTEKVYVDGRLLKRGQENDYVIDYNMAEITFTPHQPITKDRRIVIEFEYSDKNYARFMVYNSNEFASVKNSFWVNVFSEQDSRNQTIQQDLDDNDKNILAMAGDSLSQAFVYNIDSVEYTNDYVLYRLADTTVAGVHYDSIYIYSTHPDSAHYRLGFSFVGEGNGNYILSQTSANGRVYSWVAPVGGIKQGNYEPLVLLVAPRKKQMISAGGRFLITENLTAMIDMSVTNNDLNTFSSLHSDDNIGYAVKSGLALKIPLPDSTAKLTLAANYQLVDRYFNPIERFRSTEFERDWNLGNGKLTGQEHFTSFSADYHRAATEKAAYEFEFMNRDAQLNAIRNNASLLLKKRGFTMDASGSMLNTENSLNATRFLRHRASLSKNLYGIVLGVSEEQEDNRWRKMSNDSLLGNSFSFTRWGVFIQSDDSAKTRVFAGYDNRRDYFPSGNSLAYTTLGEDYHAGVQLMKNPKNILKATITYRLLTIIDTVLSTNTPENTATGRLEHNLRLFKNAITTGTFYEIGSGLEIKREFSYLEVSPGQGVYTWSDYNGNGVKELDEFEVANFSDQAGYIRVFTPTDEYIKTYTNQFSQLLVIRPQTIWGKEKGIKKFVSRFSDQFAYRINRKNIQDDMLLSANPFYMATGDSLLISMGASTRNTFSFNKTGTKFGIDHIIQSNKNRILLVNGIDTRTILTNGLQGRWNITRYLTLINNFSLGEKTSESEFFPSKDYRISFYRNEASFRIQPTMSIRFSVNYKYYQKENLSGTEMLTGNDAGIEVRYNVLEKGNLTLTANYIHLSFNSPTNGPVAYDMLEGFMPGHNAQWTFQYNRNLSKSMQMNISYNGRASEGSKVVHIMGVQLRAYF